MGRDIIEGKKRGKRYGSENAGLLVIRKHARCICCNAGAFSFPQGNVNSHKGLKEEAIIAECVH